jgi:glycosyltransferase involved in cell wall biosynthesis
MLNPAFSGGHWTHELCEALAAQGCDVELFTGPQYGLTVGDAAGRSYRVRVAFYRFTQLRSYRRDWQRPLWRLARLFGHLWSLARTAALARRFDVVHVQFLPLLAVDAWWVAWVARRSCFVHTVHDLYPHDARPTRSLQRQLRLVYWSSTRLISHTRYTRERLMKEFGVASERIALIPLGAARPFVGRDGGGAQPPRDLRGPEPIVLMIGQLRPGKGLDTLLRAAALLRDDGVPFRVVVAGDCQDPQPYFQLVRDLRLEGLVHIRAERFPEQDVSRYFEAASVVAFPYRAIDQSGAATMAVTFGRAIVATRLAGLAELVEGADCGVLVPPDDPRELAAGLKKVLSDEGLRRRYEANALRYAQTALAWPAIAERTMAVYRAAVAERRAPRS